ncbi:MAG: hypothetical protein E6033_18665, partial [Klebsiella pneumoniae]|nr:hypothetical protein [Klebsiella pneumoniae]
VNDFMDSVHHIWCPLSSQEYQDLPDGAETTLTFIQKVRLTKSAFKLRKRLILPENAANDGSYQNRKKQGSSIHMED